MSKPIALITGVGEGTGAALAHRFAQTEREVEYLDERLDEPDPGHILICCSRPTSNLVIEV